MLLFVVISVAPLFVASMGTLLETPDFKALRHLEIQRSFSGGDRFNQRFVNMFDKGLNLTDICLYEKRPCLIVVIR